MTKDSAISRSGNRLAALVLACFFLSGITGLVYQILWTRMAVKIIGAAPFAVSIILTIFMAGLGLGSYLAGRYLRHAAEPARLIRLYGLLELGVAGFAILIPALIALSTPVFSLIYNQLFSHFWLYSLVTFLGCVLIFTMPVVLMGATLPVLSRFYVTRLSHLGTHVGRLYGLNTIGAAVGAFVCGFWLIYSLGINGTLIVAVVTNALIGLVCYFAGGMTASGGPVKGKPAVSMQPEPADKPVTAGQDPWATKGVLLIFAVSGFCAMAYEVIWTRLLGLVVGPTTYSFTIVLVTFILGLALGSMFFGWLADRTGRPFGLLLTTQFMAAVTALLVSQLLGDSQLFFAKLIYEFRDSFGWLHLAKGAALFLFMIFPTLCLGAAFPLVGKLYTPSVARVGTCVGNAYAINTIGAVLGSFSGGFLLIPLLGKEHGLSLVVALQLVTALLVGAAVLWRGREGVLRPALLASACLGGLLLTFHFPAWNHTLLSTGRYQRFEGFTAEIQHTGWIEALLQGTRVLAGARNRELVYYGEGIGGFTTVTSSDNGMGRTIWSLLNSGKPDASSYWDMHTQTLMAHFPMLFHKKPENVMVLGLASGITAGEILHYPVKHLDIVEINDQVVKASDFFLPLNGHVLSNPKTRLIIQDARAHLKLTDRRYDVITSEPSNPWMAGLAALFTRDFYEIVRDRLNEDGIFAQFIHSYQMDWPTFALVGRTFAEVFPNSALVVNQPNGDIGDFLLVGFKGKAGMNLDNARRNLEYVRQSDNIVLTDPVVLYRLLASENLQALFGPGPVHTDDRPLLEFSAPRLMYRDDRAFARNLIKRRSLDTAASNIVARSNTDPGARMAHALFALSVYKPFNNMLYLSELDGQQTQQYIHAVERYCAENPVRPDIFDAGLARKCRRIQIDTMAAHLEKGSDQAVSYAEIASLYAEEGDREAAFRSYSRSLQLNPDNAPVHASLGALLVEQGRFNEAVPHFREALQIDPGYAPAHNNLGAALMNLGRSDEAVAQFREALRLDPDYGQARKNLDKALAHLGQSMSMKTMR